ncbi:hypothetical protein BCR33DRAFT_326617 [Rhizoclosmatium globosum]|uniref:Uncharacterized protein n=1 Tax=Rhizoclosmatium globosum TaxID=329046 RepID=A0A1Y2C4D3_9FUNG|nr:hypothetical protein BCR33DRAFT_326617 [Rhizoclosmatium globosum]|eukprot:ORY41871.1 hypothetical protein BCR33DRAFT_326617 [Rhizoclosmatium globosum]
MTDQSHVVQALKDAVNSVDALRGTVSESREQWRNIILPNSETHSAAFRSRSVDHFNQPFKLNSHSASRSPELRGGSPERGYLGSQPVFTSSAGSAFVRPEPQFRTTSPQQQQFPHHQQQSSYSFQNYPPATIITPQPIPQQPVTQQTHQSQHQFEQRMHEIVSSAVNEAIARETPTSIKHPDPKPKSFKDMEAERIINESLSSSSNTNQNQEPFTESPSISPIPHSTSQHKHNYSSSFESSKTLHLTPNTVHPQFRELNKYQQSQNPDTHLPKNKHLPLPTPNLHHLQHVRLLNHNHTHQSPNKLSSQNKHTS